MKMTFAVVVMVMTVKSRKCSCFWKKRSEIRFHIPILHHYDIFPPGGNAILLNGFCGDGDDVNDDNDNVTVDSVLMTKL